MALTHENATAEERMPYLSWLFDPVPVFNLVGRSADMFPPCKKHECVWYAWKDWHCRWLIPEWPETKSEPTLSHISRVSLPR